MDDRELLGLLAAEAPAPRPGLADEVVARARRTRTRRRWKAAAGGLALAAAVAIAVPVVLQHESALQSDSSAAKPASGPLEGQKLREKSGEAYSLGDSAPEALASGRSAGSAAVYEAAIDAFLKEGTNDDLRKARPLRILDQVCPLRGECADRPLDRGLKRELSERMPEVSFVQDDLTLDLVEPLRLGEARIDGDKARVPVSGRLLRLELSRGRWQVVGGL
ncbi:hypothetical protein [Actinocorallia populi]|uniref:hypothetical protein n=1 Tax=Actinocorallia populi TaxID=2079200 RepID=UPI000D093E77|nr:hypothetical protein [Actinocorallia populi]